MTKARVAAYLLRDIPEDVWQRVKRRATKEGRSLRFIILALLKRYADKGLNGD